MIQSSENVRPLAIFLLILGVLTLIVFGLAVMMFGGYGCGAPDAEQPSCFVLPALFFGGPFIVFGLVALIVGFLTLVRNRGKKTGIVDVGFFDLSLNNSRGVLNNCVLWVSIGLVAHMVFKYLVF